MTDELADDPRFMDIPIEPEPAPKPNGVGSRAPRGKEKEETDGPLAFEIADWDARTVFDGDAPRQAWLIGGTIPRGVAGIIAGAGDVGKSYTALDLCLLVSGGPRCRVIPEFPILGGLVQSYGATVFITAEDSKASVHRRMRALDPDGHRQAGREYSLYVVPLADAGGLFPIVALERGKVVATPQFDALRQQLQAIPDLALVVFDPLQCFVHADINADPQAAAMTMALLNMVASQTGATVVVTHHVRKERDAPKTAQEARYLIRGTSALVDQSRFAIVIWTPDDPIARKACKTLGADYSPNAIVHGAVVKSNDGASRKLWTTLRRPDGVLRDVTATLANRTTPTVELVTALVEAIAAAAEAGRPYTRTGINGLYDRRAELGEPFADVAKHQLANLVDNLLQAERVVQALASGTTVKWLDVPAGLFAQGKGVFAAGANPAKQGRKAASHAH